MKITAQVPANLSWHQCIGCLEEMARKMEKDDLERISIHDAKRLGALVGFVETVVQHREQLAIQDASKACPFFWNDKEKAWGCVLANGHKGNHSPYA